MCCSVVVCCCCCCCVVGLLPFLTLMLRCGRKFVVGVVVLRFLFCCCVFCRVC